MSHSGLVSTGFGGVTTTGPFGVLTGSRKLWALSARTRKARRNRDRSFATSPLRYYHNGGSPRYDSCNSAAIAL